MEIFINQLRIDARNVTEETNKEEGGAKKIIAFDFKVKSEDSHRVTTELYKNDFLLRIPEKQLELPVEIYNYSTSITDLSEKDAIADFKLALIEK